MGTVPAAESGCAGPQPSRPLSIEPGLFRRRQSHVVGGIIAAPTVDGAVESDPAADEAEADLVVPAARSRGRVPRFRCPADHLASGTDTADARRARG